jgi:hypothetical protein
MRLGGTDESVPDPFLLLAAAAHPARHARILHQGNQGKPGKPGTDETVPSLF